MELSVDEGTLAFTELGIEGDYDDFPLKTEFEETEASPRVD